MDNASNLENSKGLKLMNVNIIVFLIRHFDEFKIFVDQYKPDLIGVNETRLDESITDSDISIEGYNVYRHDRSRNGGGVCLYVNSGLNCNRRADLENDNTEAVWVHLQLTHKKSVLVCSLYRPPHRDDQYFSSIINKLENVLCMAINTILIGDVNIDIHSKNEWTKQYYSTLCDYLHLEQLINDYTMVTISTKTVIDHIYTNNKMLHSSSGVITWSVSDHYPIYTILNFSKPDRSKFVTRRNLRYFDPERFRNEVLNMFSNFNFKITDVDTMWHNWYESFMSVCNSQAPLNTYRVKSRSLPWLSREILDKMYERDRLHQQAVTSRSSELMSAYRKQRNRVSRLLRDAKKTYFHKKRLNESGNNSSDMWKVLRMAINASKTSQSDISCKSVEELNDYFINAAGCINNNNSVKDVLSNLKCKKFVFDIIYVDKVFNLLAKLPDKVNSDILSLDSKLLHSVADIIAPSLTFIFNLSLQSGLFPAELKKAKVVPHI